MSLGKRCPQGDPDQLAGIADHPADALGRSFPIRLLQPSDYSRKLCSVQLRSRETATQGTQGRLLPNLDRDRTPGRSQGSYLGRHFRCGDIELGLDPCRPFPDHAVSLSKKRGSLENGRKPRSIQVEMPGHWLGHRLVRFCHRLGLHARRRERGGTGIWYDFLHRRANAGIFPSSVLHSPSQPCGLGHWVRPVLCPSASP